MAIQVRAEIEEIEAKAETLADLQLGVLARVTYGGELTCLRWRGTCNRVLGEHSDGWIDVMGIDPSEYKVLEVIGHFRVHFDADNGSELDHIHDAAGN